MYWNVFIQIPSRKNINKSFIHQNKIKKCSNTLIEEQANNNNMISDMVIIVPRFEIIMQMEGPFKKPKAKD